MTIVVGKDGEHTEIKGDPFAKPPENVQIAASQIGAYLYADKEGDRPVQYLVALSCSVPGIPTDLIAWRYRKRSWPSEHWCEFATGLCDPKLPVRAGGHLVVQARWARDGTEAKNWSEEWNVFVSKDGVVTVKRDADCAQVVPDDSWGRVQQDAKGG